MEAPFRDLRGRAGRVRRAPIPKGSLAANRRESRVFNVGRIDRDQLEDYARRKGEAVEVTERWIGSQLAYEPAEFSVKC